MTDAWRDPGVRAIGVLCAVAAAGLVGLYLAWRGVAATLAVWEQVSFVASGVFGGMALTGTALGILSIHLRRRSAAEERAALEELIALFAEMADRS